MLPSLDSFLSFLPDKNEDWIIKYYFQQDILIEEGLSLENVLLPMKEIVPLPFGYHQALLDYTTSFNNSFSVFLKEKYGIEKPFHSLFTHPVDKVRKDNDDLDYISFIGPIGVKYLPRDSSLQGKGALFIDKNHPLELVAPDETMYTYFGINGLEGFCSRFS